MLRRKYKTNQYTRLSNKNPSLSSNATHLPSKMPLCQHPNSAQNITTQQSFDFTNYLRQLQHGFRQSCRADIVSRRTRPKIMDSSKNMESRTSSAKHVEKSSLVYFKKQIECLQEDKQRWDHINFHQNKEKKQVHSQTQVISKISTINIDSFHQDFSQHRQSLLSQFKNTFQKGMYNPLKATIEANIKKYHVNHNTNKRKAQRRENFRSLSVQKQNVRRPIHNAAFLFTPSVKSVRHSKMMTRSNKSHMANENDMLMCRAAKMNSFEQTFD